MPDGFLVCMIFNKRFIKWTAVRGFVVRRMGNGEDSVAWDLVEGEPRTKNVETFREIHGCDDALMDDYGVKQQDLAHLMNEWRARA